MVDTSFLDWPFFEDRHRQLAEGLERWCQDNLRSAHADTPSVDARCVALVRELGRAGWLLETSPDPSEMKPLDVRALCLIRETLARHDALADFAFAMQGLGAGALSLFGSPEQRRLWLPRTRAGGLIAAFALSEPRSGSDVANLECSAAREGAHWVLDGEKTWISNGGIADYYVVFARTGGAGAKGLSAFVVSADAPGLEVAERLETMAPHPLARLRFDGVRIPEASLIGSEGAGFKIAMSVLDVFRSTVGAAALGLARRAMSLSIERATTRNLFGAPLADLQMTQSKIADMALGVDASALLVYRAAWRKDSGVARVTREAAMAKLHATESAQTIIDDAVQIHGGEGVRVGNPVEALYREIRALRIYEGASEVQKVVIAKQAIAGEPG